MRNSSILKLAKKNNKLVNGTKNANGGGKEEKKWLHAPETLLAGHVVYLVKVSQSVNDIDRRDIFDANKSFTANEPQ